MGVVIRWRLCRLPSNKFNTFISEPKGCWLADWLIDLPGTEPAWPFPPISSLYAELGKDKWPLTVTSYLPYRHELSHVCTRAAHQESVAESGTVKSD